MNRLLIFLFCLIIIGCERSEKLTPVELILGKWEIIQMGNWPAMIPIEDNDYSIFYPDSILMHYSFTSKGSLSWSEKYWIDSLFNISQTANNGLIYLTQYTYDF
jgi:hypothetical protein